MGYGKLLLLAGAGAAAAFVLSGDADASSTETDKKRDPWTKPIDAPDDSEIPAVKQAFCTCFRGGATDEDALAACALKQVYGDEPWSDLLVPVAGDSREVRTVIGKFVEWARELIALPNDEAVTQWCGGTKPDPKGPIVEPPPPPTEDDPKTKIRQWWLEMQSGLALPGFFREIVKDDGGLEVLAREVYKSLGIDSPSYSNLIKPLMVAFSAGKRWNAKLYGRTAKKKIAEPTTQRLNTPNDETWYASDGVVIKPAWLPRNQNPDAAVLDGRAPKRNIFNDGSKIGPGASYGTIYTPRFNVELARDQGVFVMDDDANYDPPAEFLALLGM